MIFTLRLSFWIVFIVFLAFVNYCNYLNYATNPQDFTLAWSAIGSVLLLALAITLNLRLRDAWKEIDQQLTNEAAESELKSDLCDSITSSQHG